MYSSGWVPTDGNPSECYGMNSKSTSGLKWYMELKLSLEGWLAWSRQYGEIIPRCPLPSSALAEVWNFVFRGHLNDQGIPSVTEFFNTIDQFSGLKAGQDIILWQGNRKWTFKVNAVYRKLNHPNQQLTNWPWKYIWIAKISHKVGCFVWLLAKEAVLKQDNLMKGGIRLCSICFSCWKPQT